jgi:hypothetical protein
MIVRFRRKSWLPAWRLSKPDAANRRAPGSPDPASPPGQSSCTGTYRRTSRRARESEAENCVRTVYGGFRTGDGRRSLRRHINSAWRNKLLKRLLEEVFWRDSVQLTLIAFQACSIDHSDISPFYLVVLPVRQISIRRAGPADAQRIGLVFDAPVRDGWTYLGALARQPMFEPRWWDKVVAEHAPPKHPARRRRRTGRARGVRGRPSSGL